MNFQKRILVIDGDQDFGNSILKSLRLHKYDVCFVSSGEAGIQKAFEYQPDLILCDTDLQTIDGFLVHKVLLESLVLKSIPFIFLKLNANIQQIRHGMNLGADDFFSKPISIADLLRSIEIRLEKFQTSCHHEAHEFTTLFELSPNGIMVFNQSAILRANRSIQSLLKIDHQKPIALQMEDIFKNGSLLKIKNWIHQPQKGAKSVFKEKIILKDLLGEELKMDLVMFEFAHTTAYTEFIGFFTPIVPVASFFINGPLVSELFELMEQEKITIPDHVGEKITRLVQQRAINFISQENTLFTKRENQVLFLTMEGLPIKNIAHQLSISTRTVEKYRTNLMEKSGAKNIVEVIVFALKNGLIHI